MSNKTSDKNVANVEDDVKILKEFAEICKRGISVYNPQEAGEALEHILAEREQDKKRIKELEEEKVELKEYNKIVSDRIVEYKKNSIPKQAVIDKIKEYDKKMEEDAGHPNWVVTDRIVMNVLQELLETK